MNWMKRIPVTILMSYFVAGCSKSSKPGKYIYQSANEVDMFDLVEAPAGHLSGTLVVSAINLDGIRKPDVTRSVSGSSYRGNVSLQIGNNGIFSSGFNAVGTLNGDEMRLDFGGDTENFQKTSSRKYQAALVELNKKGDILKQKYAVTQQTQNLNNYLDALDAELQNFIRWGNDRIARAANVGEWYAGRISEYQKCIDFVQPIAARRVPSWKWQSCVINMDNDEYNRQQSADTISQIHAKAAEEEQDLNAKIATVSQRVLELSNSLEQMCLLSASESDCKLKVNTLMKGMPPTSLSKHIEEYREILPQLDRAIIQEMQAREDGEKHLDALVSEADSLLRGSH